jgi:hypothetical protein
MGEIVNLRRARKAKTRAASVTEAAANRTEFGQGRAAREAAQAARDLETRRLDAHKRESSDVSPDENGA